MPTKAKFIEVDDATGEIILALEVFRDDLDNAQQIETGMESTVAGRSRKRLPDNARLPNPATERWSRTRGRVEPKP